jgi:hypothetical protein
MLQSTRELLRQSGFRLRTLHGYVYARWTQRYMKALFTLPPPGSSPAARKAVQKYADTHHGKVLALEHARAIVTLERPPSPISSKSSPFRWREISCSTARRT